jgi:hypothetical protein
MSKFSSETVQLAEAAERQPGVVHQFDAQRSSGADHYILRPDVVDIVAAGYRSRYDRAFVGQRIRLNILCLASET